MTHSRPTGISPRRCAPLRCAPATAQDVSVNAVGLAGLAVTYDEELHAPFYEAIAQGQRGDGSLLDLFAHGFVDEFDLGPTFAVNCLDLPHPTTAADVEALAARAAGAATVLPELSGAYVRAFALPCTHWPVPAPAALEPVTAPGAPPILVVGNTGDPVTPFESAQRIAATLEHGHLLTYARRRAHHLRQGPRAPTPTSTRTCSTSRSLPNRPSVHDHWLRRIAVSVIPRDADRRAPSWRA